MEVGGGSNLLPQLTVSGSCIFPEDMTVMWSVLHLHRNTGDKSPDETACTYYVGTDINTRYLMWKHNGFHPLVRVHW